MCTLTLMLPDKAIELYVIFFSFFFLLEVHLSGEFNVKWSQCLTVCQEAEQLNIASKNSGRIFAALIDHNRV